MKSRTVNLACIHLRELIHAQRVTTARRGGEPLSHVLWMTGEIEKLMKDKRKGKAMRWLGFAQGVVYAEGLCTIEQFRRVNKGEWSATERQFDCQGEAA